MGLESTAGLYILTVMNIQVVIFWVVTPCNDAVGYTTSLHCVTTQKSTT